MECSLNVVINSRGLPVEYISDEEFNRSSMVIVSVSDQAVVIIWEGYCLCIN